LGLLPRGVVEGDDVAIANADSSRYLLRTLTRAAPLAAIGVAAPELLLLQLEKIAVNASLNPLTVLLDCRNGDLLHNWYATRVMRLLVAEISVIIRALPEVRGLPNVEARFSAAKLEARVRSIIQSTALNYSSMLVDVRNGRPTEINYITGFLVRKGEDLGIRCMMNYLVLQLIHSKEKIMGREAQSHLPLERTT